MKFLGSVAYTLCWSISIVCCELPAFVVSTVAEKYKDLHDIRVLKRPPPAILRKKRRSLTPPPVTRSRLPGNRRQIWADQSESLLLTALPYELRVMIWKYVVGDQYIHLGLLKCPTNRGRLAYILCQSTEPSDWPRCEAACFKRWHTYQPESNQRLSLSYNVKPWKPPLIELLQTCHQIYSETIDLIYECNTFDTTVSNCTRFLPRFLLPQRLNAIRTLRLEWRILAHETFFGVDGLEKTTKDQLYYQKEWKDTWKCLADMKGLRDLRVKLNFVQYSASILCLESSFLDPIKEVTAPDVFEVSISRWAMGGMFYLTGSTWVDLPCKVDIFSSRVSLYGFAA
ncbi:hypothetical protein GLAREA_12750 [Glarea lozoyensis ATCC 20868]|uniref:DUF7730 domain-containing protein n=1 Tax=Glarea lozoyensis (strain ATCC 20868 / MF5171) TaxID=1116229 RepID=S3CYV0_GLAL2|nr:uncharacterized protein GLAREA_12750 [Glarea lozoyensis ATCC 20868]EPE31447.1 hypothetical protein GLAREA_12750 [Glarea lozoyensis ATCC 20868]